MFVYGLILGLCLTWSSGLQIKAVFDSQTVAQNPLIDGKAAHSKISKRFAEIGGIKATRRDTTRVWHVGIYRRPNDYTIYGLTQICGGTLVTMKAVISAAHCFWSEEDGAMVSPDFYAVEAGKLKRMWAHQDDNNFRQWSEVQSIHVPPRYRGAMTSFQDDIAVVLLKLELEPRIHTKPACVDFREEFEKEQLTNGSMGTVLGWGLTAEDGHPSNDLTYLELPYIEIEECLAEAGPSFLKYITSDKICAGVKDGRALCQGDSGGGLVFLHEVEENSVPYLRGVASTAPRNEHLCNAHAIAAFTHITPHRAFLRAHITGLEEECQMHYEINIIWGRIGAGDREVGHGIVLTNSETEQARQECMKLTGDCYCYCNKTET